MACGYRSLYLNTSGSNNSGVGVLSLTNCTEGDRNSAYGSATMFTLTTGDDNVGFGFNALYSCSTGNGNVALGTKAGYFETGSNKLYVANSDTTTPLIYGEFDNATLKINGELQSTSKRETKVVSSTTETLSSQDATYVNINTAGNTLSLSDMVDGSRLQLNNSSSGEATLNFDVKLGTTTFTAPVTMPSGDSYEVTYDAGEGVWVM
jgi:hypothetical protein